MNNSLEPSINKGKAAVVVTVAFNKLFEINLSATKALEALIIPLIEGFSLEIQDTQTASSSQLANNSSLVREFKISSSFGVISLLISKIIEKAFLFIRTLKTSSIFFK